MGGTLSEFGGRVGVTYFMEFLQAPSRAQLVAAVIQRHDPASVNARGTPIWRGLWSLLFRRRPKPIVPPSAGPPDGWSASAGDGANAVLYSSSRRLVRVSGREFELPSNGQTLILLVDVERTRPCEGPDVIVRTIDTPSVPHCTFDHNLDKATNQKRIAASRREEHAAWRRSLRSDSVTHVFLEVPE
jgi:hypothetical protein